jgi:hypothetical protein
VIVDATFHKAPPQQFQQVRKLTENLHTIVLAFHDGHEYTIPVKEVKGIIVTND